MKMFDKGEWYIHKRGKFLASKFFEKNHAQSEITCLKEGGSIACTVVHHLAVD
jgi:hypothetical protein